VRHETAVLRRRADATNNDDVALQFGRKDGAHLRTSDRQDFAEREHAESAVPSISAALTSSPVAVNRRLPLKSPAIPRRWTSAANAPPRRDRREGAGPAPGVEPTHQERPAAPPVHAHSFQRSTVASRAGSPGSRLRVRTNERRAVLRRNTPE